MRAPKENWQAPISNISASGCPPKAPGRKQSPMNIINAPAAMIQVAVFEDMNLNPSGGKENGYCRTMVPNHGAEPWCRSTVSRRTYPVTL
jgi:hypothetical protein